MKRGEREVLGALPHSAIRGKRRGRGTIGFLFFKGGWFLSFEGEEALSSEGEKGS